MLERTSFFKMHGGRERQREEKKEKERRERMGGKEKRGTFFSPRN